MPNPAKGSGIEAKTNGIEALQREPWGWQPYGVGVPSLAKAMPNPAQGSGIEENKWQ
jgi:hypothetical protein